jgi:hypothetical protein
MKAIVVYESLWEIPPLSSGAARPVVASLGR